MLTLDASVFINALNPSEAGSSNSLELLRRIRDANLVAIQPTLLIVEIAAAISRARDDSDVAMRFANRLHAAPGFEWVALDNLSAQSAVDVAARFKLRGADAIYATVAKLTNSVLVTRDRQQLERLPVDFLKVQTPEQALFDLTQ